MKTKETKSLSKIALARTKSTFAKKSSVFACVIIFMIIALALALLTPYTLILTLPLLIFPSIFAYISVNTVADQNLSTDLKSFFLLFRLYFGEHFNGCFKIILGFLKALLCFIAVSLLISFVGTFIITKIDPSFSTTLMQIMSIEDETEFINQFNDFFANNPYMSTLVEVEIYSCFAGASLMFVHHTMFNGIKYYMNLLSTTPIFAKDLNTIFSAVYKKNKKNFRKDYYKGVWFLPLILLVGFVGGILFGKFVINLEPALNVIVGLFFALVVTMPFLPYYFDFTLTLFKKYQPAFINTFIDLSIETINEMKKTKTLSPEKEKEILQFLDKQKEDKSEDAKDEKNHD